MENTDSNEVLYSIKEALARLEEKTAGIEKHLSSQLVNQELRLQALEISHGNLKSEVNIQMGKWTILIILISALVGGVVTSSVGNASVPMEAVTNKLEYKINRILVVDDGLGL